MILSRRNLLASGAAAATVAAVGGSHFAAGAPPALVVYDSRRTDSLAFARSIAAPRIDIAREDANLWRAVRSAAVDGTVVGLTGWSDWVLVRGMLEEKGKRLRREARVGRLFQWTMG